MTDESVEGLQSSKTPGTFSRRGALELGVKAAVATGASAFLEHYTFLYPQKAEAQVGPTNFPLEAGAGWFYKETRGDETDPQLGYQVTSPIWPIFQKYGGVGVWGFPETRPFRDDIGRLCQGFQKGIFQLTVDSQGKLVKPPEWANLFDQLSEMGEDDWLEQQFIPKPFKFEDTGKSPEEVERSRLALLESYPQLKEAFFRSSKEFKNDELWKQQHGYPTAVKEYPHVISDRNQRDALHLWKIDTPWARAGEVTFANGMEVVKKKAALAARLIPIESLLLELTDPAKAERKRELEKATRERYGTKRLPENVQGSLSFVEEVSRTLTLLAQKAPEYYAFVKDNVYSIEEGNANGAGVTLRFVRLVMPKIFSESDRLMFASFLIHEAKHCELYGKGLQAGYRFGETAAELVRVGYGRVVRDPRIVQDAQGNIDRTDTLAGQYLREQKG